MSSLRTQPGETSRPSEDTRAGGFAAPRLLIFLVLAAVAALFLARLLPAGGAGLWLRLGVAVACVLLLPGAPIAAAIHGRGDPALVITAAIPWSLAGLFASLIVTFLVGGSVSLTLVLLALTTVGGLAAVWLRPIRSGRRSTDTRTVLAVIAAGLLFGVILWLAATPIAGGDALEHLARVRKLAELPHLRSGVTELFREAGLHPGYAFPLWHGAMASITRLAGVDSAVAMERLPALLAPLAFLTAYAAGRAVFGSRWGGLAGLGGQLGYFALANAGTGLFLRLFQPHQAVLLLLVPALMALLFTFIESERRSGLLSVGAASLAVAVVHTSYLPFMVITLVGFLVARVLLGRQVRREGSKISMGIGAVVLPAVLFYLWLVPAAVTRTQSFTPVRAEQAAEIAHYLGQIQVMGGGFRLAPRAVSAAGPVAVMALLAIPLAGLAPRTRWAALAIGGTIPVLLLLLVPQFFRTFTEVASISQGRRLVAFLPWSVGFAGGALLLGRARLVGVMIAIGVGIALWRLYPGDFSYATTRGGGPSWAVWFALGGSLVALSAGVLRPQWELVRGGGDKWMAVVAAALIAPMAIGGFSHVHVSHAREPLTPGLIAALGTHVPERAIVFALPRTSYMIVAYAPVYVANVPVGHAWDRREERVRDAGEFFSREVLLGDQQRILAKYGAEWLVVDAGRPPAHLASMVDLRVYADRLYALYRVRIP
jgi:uncharacterized membrane protein YuzA (DUF378 family)